MGLFTRPSRAVTARLDAFADAAEAYAGYRAIPGRDTEFEARTGSAAHKRWDGAFVWCAAEDAGFVLPSLNDPSQVLRPLTGKPVRVPRRGDIAVLAWDSHIGVVLDTVDFLAYGKFTCVEGQVSSGLPRGPQENDGVHVRVRYAPSDVLLFVRPNLADKGEPPAPADAVASAPLLHPSNFVGKHTKQFSSTVLLQTALGAHEGADLENAVRGSFDLQTRRAVAQLQRYWGATASRATGIPDESFLVRLGTETGVFRVRGAGS